MSNDTMLMLIASDSTDTEHATTPDLVSQIMSQMGRKGGKIGGKRRLVTMTPERRKEVAQLAAQKRWAKERAKQANRMPFPKPGVAE
jgi:hypothetical protein